jgi:hypothetical protein
MPALPGPPPIPDQVEQDSPAVSRRDCRAADQRPAVRNRACWTRSSASCRLPTSKKAKPSNCPPSRATKAENSASSPPASVQLAIRRLTLHATTPAPSRLSADSRRQKEDDLRRRMGIRRCGRRPRMKPPLDLPGKQPTPDPPPGQGTGEAQATRRIARTRREPLLLRLVLLPAVAQRDRGFTFVHGAGDMHADRCCPRGHPQRRSLEVARTHAASNQRACSANVLSNARQVGDTPRVLLPPVVKQRTRIRRPARPLARCWYKMSAVQI